MRRDKTVARILLIFSATNVVFASPAVVPQSHLDVTKAASEKRADGTTSGTTVNLPPPESESHPPLRSESLPPAFKHYEDMMQKFNGDSSAPGRQPESSSSNPPAESGGHLPPPPPPPPPRPQRQNFLPSAAVPAEASHFITSEVKHKIILGGLVTAFVGSIAGIAYGMKYIVNEYKAPYVSLLSLLSTPNQVTNIPAYDLPQRIPKCPKTIRSEGSK